MKTDYIRHLNGSKLVIYPNTNISFDDYRIQMPMLNKMNNFLNFNCDLIDNNVKYIYEITNLDNLTNFLENKKIDYNFLFQFLKSLNQAIMQANSHLLDSQQILLDMDYIYVDDEARNFYFCIYPSLEQKMINSFHNIIKEFEQHLKNDDKGAILIKELLSDNTFNYSIERILDNAVGRYYEKHRLNDEMCNMDKVNERLYEIEEYVPEDKEPRLKQISSFKSFFSRLNEKFLS